MAASESGSGGIEADRELEELLESKRGTERRGRGPPGTAGGLRQRDKGFKVQVALFEGREPRRTAASARQPPRPTPGRSREPPPDLT